MSGLTIARLASFRYVITRETEEIRNLPPENRKVFFCASLTRVLAADPGALRLGTTGAKNSLSCPARDVTIGAIDRRDRSWLSGPARHDVARGATDRRDSIFFGVRS